MKKLLLILTLLLLTSVSLFAQAGSVTTAPVTNDLTLAGTATGDISIKNVLNNPILTSNTGALITGFDISWVVISGDGQTYQGPYTIKGNTVNGIAITQLKEDAARGKISRMFIDKVLIRGTDGKAANTTSVRAYKAIP